jgi:glycosyltransferase involved in cell wall biosynthesis
VAATAQRHGVTGRLVPTQDATPPPQGVVDLLSDPDRASALSGAARERMLSRFQLDRMVDETLAVYREVGLP